MINFNVVCVTGTESRTIEMQQQQQEKKNCASVDCKLILRVILPLMGMTLLKVKLEEKDREKKRSSEMDFHRSHFGCGAREQPVSIDKKNELI